MENFHLFSIKYGVTIEEFCEIINVLKKHNLLKATILWADNSVYFLKVSLVTFLGKETIKKLSNSKIKEFIKSLISQGSNLAFAELLEKIFSFL